MKKPVVLGILAILVVGIIFGILYSGIGGNISSYLGKHEIVPVSLGKYETLNGKEYEFIQNGTGFYFRKGDGNLSESYSSTGEIQLFLNEKNPLIKQEWTDVFDKKYIINNYKGVHVRNAEGKDIGKSFSDIPEAIKYLEGLNPPNICVVTLTNYIKSSTAYSNLNEDYKAVIEKYKNKTRVVKLVSPYACEGGKKKITGTDNKKVFGKTNIQYILQDSLAFTLEGARNGMLGFGPPADYDEADIVTDMKEISVQNDNGLSKGKIQIYIFQSGKNNLVLDIGGIQISKNGVSKDTVDQVKEDLTYFAKSLSIYPQGEDKIIGFDWSSVNAKGGVEYNVQHDKYYGKYEYGVTVFTDKDGQTKAVSPENGSAIAGCGTSTMDCEFQSYNSAKNSVIIKARTFNNVEQSHGTWTNYLMNIDTGKVSIQ